MVLTLDPDRGRSLGPKVTISAANRHPGAGDGGLAAGGCRHRLASGAIQLDASAGNSERVIRPLWKRI